MSRRRLKGLNKVAEECCELVHEVLKMDLYPDGKHPRRKKNIILSVEEEAADAMAIINYIIDRNKLNRAKIMRRMAYKYRKHEKRWGVVPKVKKTSKKAKKQAAKIRAAGQSSQRDASIVASNVE